MTNPKESKECCAVCTDYRTEGQCEKPNCNCHIERDAAPHHERTDEWEERWYDFSRDLFIQVAKPSNGADFDFAQTQIASFIRKALADARKDERERILAALPPKSDRYEAIELNTIRRIISSPTKE